MEKTYILFEFNYQPRNGNSASMQKLQAVCFKYPEGYDIRKEINSYFNEFRNEEKNKAWKLAKPNNFSELTIEEISTLIKNFLFNCNSDYEEISKEEYESWSEQNKVLKLEI